MVPHAQKRLCSLFQTGVHRFFEESNLRFRAVVAHIANDDKSVEFIIRLRFAVLVHELENSLETRRFARVGGAVEVYVAKDETSQDDRGALRFFGGCASCARVERVRDREG